MNNNEPIVKNAVRCSICGGLADRYHTYYQCTNNPNHFGDLYVGISSDLTFPEKDLTLKQGWHRMPVLVNLFFRC